jgi:hypothetical protein
MFSFGSTKQSPNVADEDKIRQFTIQLKDALMSVGKGGPGKPIGIELGTKQEFEKEVNGLIESIKSSYTSYASDMAKAKQIKTINEKLVGNYTNNLKVIVDVSKLLSSYVELFNVLKQQLVELNRVMGRDAANIQDIRYLEQITQEKVQVLQNELTTQTSALKKIYADLGLSQQTPSVDVMTPALQEISSEATNILRSGGAKKKKTPKKAVTSSKGSKKC